MFFLSLHQKHRRVRSGDGDATKRPNAFCPMASPSLGYWLFALEVEMLLSLQTEHARLKREEVGKGVPCQLLDFCKFFMREGKLPSKLPLSAH